MTGKIHSTESMGTVDGPGIRFVIFMQGCPMHCLYCHNPDTWTADGGTEVTPEELLKKMERYRPYLKGGGITVSGGEPLLQMDFVTELFCKAKEKRIHTCLDTSGITFRRKEAELCRKFVKLAEVTDLVLLDIKHTDREEHEKLTGHPPDNILDFARFLQEQRVETWIRHVVVPGITYSTEQLLRLGRFIGTLNNVRAVDVLPYHTMGKAKYEKMGMEYPLKDTLPLTKEQAAKARQVILAGIAQTKNKKENSGDEPL